MMQVIYNCLSNHLSSISILSRILIILFFLFFTNQSFSQVSTKSDYKGTWINSSSWNSGSQPSPLTNAIDDDITINGYITREGELSFSNVNFADNFTIIDTLVIETNLTFANKAANLVIPAGGILIVLGNFVADNKVTVDNGGLLIVKGSMTFSNSPQDDYIDNGGGLYVDGGLSGNGDASTASSPYEDLATDYPDIYDFIENGTPLPVELLDFKADEQENHILISWSTASELNNDFFTLEKSKNGDDFTLTGTVSGNGTTNILSEYFFIDTSPFLGLSYYRLSQTDYDGTTEVFPIISAIFKNTSTEFSISPNPVSSPIMKLRVSGKTKNELLELNVINLQGALLEQKFFKTDNFGNAEAEFALKNPLQKGTYIFKIVSGRTKDYLKVSVK